MEPPVSDKLPEDPQGGVFIVNPQGRILLISPEAFALLGREQCPLEKHYCWEFARLRTPDDGPFCDPHCPARESLDVGESLPAQHLCYRADSQDPVQLRVSYLPLLAPTQETESVLLHRVELIPSKKTLASPAEAVQRRTHAIEHYHLSRRESQVLEHLVAGQTTAAIAKRLFISPITVRNHIQSIMKKLSVHRRLDAVLTWLNNTH